MGISPSPLHYGPTANYGSIIIACVCHCRLCLPTNYRSVSFIAPSRYGRSWRTHFAARISPMQVTYLCAVYSIIKDRRYDFLSLNRYAARGHVFEPPKQKNFLDNKKIRCFPCENSGKNRSYCVVDR